jgi:hypothetical protein
MESNQLKNLNLADWLGVRDDFRNLGHRRYVIVGEKFLLNGP